jgi:hypothetical protein
MDLKNAPEQRELTELTVGRICLDVCRGAQSKCDIDGELTQDLVTWALVMDLRVDPHTADGLSQQDRRLLYEPPTNCGHTANKIFSKLTTEAKVPGAFPNLGQHLANAAQAPKPPGAPKVAKNRRRMAFHVRILNHEFVIIVRNGKTKILQSFEGGYSFGQYLLMENTVYSLALLQNYLNHIILPYVQIQLFGYLLIPNSYDHIARYDYATLKTDKEIWEALYADAVSGLLCYKSVR